MISNKKILIYVLLFFLSRNSFSQTVCNGLGQNPQTAFPVCGTDTFKMASVPICGDRLVPGPCTASQVTDKNPYWYKFTCFSAGTLGFLIKPNTFSDDYDWQLFDVTNRNPADIYTDSSLFVSCNWSGEPGNTGASAAGTLPSVCGSTGTGPALPLFSKMPSLLLGHNYLLLISHFSDSQSGYSLSFGGGSANITDPVIPNLLKARAACDGSSVSVKLNKKMKCSSLAANGSDFSISPAIAPIISAVGIGCSTGFDMDSVVLTLGGIVPPGNYSIRIETGTDGNNLLDNCDRGFPIGQSLPVTVYPLTPTPMDSISKIGCAPVVLELVFKDPMFCNSVAADGSDFVITGTQPLSIVGATGVCSANGLSQLVRVSLSAPIQRAGNFQIKLKNGTDGNTIINECGVPTIAGAMLQFITSDTVYADFNTKLRLGCLTDTIDYLHDGKNGVNSWNWSFDNNLSSTLKATSVVFSTYGQKRASLIVTNGTCHDTSSSTITLTSNKATASFESTAVVCPGDPALFTDKSTGSVTSWEWDFGNGNTSLLNIPPLQSYPSSNSIKNIPVQLIVKNIAGCPDTAIKTIQVIGNCYIAVPKAFSPNNDGLNDFLYPTNAYKAKDLLFKVFNRFGQLVFETQNWNIKWDGTYKGYPQDPGTFVWILQYINIDTGKRIELKGSTVLIR
jgi:gliding motility-associated-like protein